MSTKHLLQKDKDIPTDLATWIAQMQEVRERLLQLINTMGDEALDFTPAERSIETIGTLLLHIAGVELGWICEDIFGEELNYEEWKHAFPLRPNINIPQFTSLI